MRVRVMKYVCKYMPERCAILNWGTTELRLIYGGQIGNTWIEIKDGKRVLDFLLGLEGCTGLTLALLSIIADEIETLLESTRERIKMFNRKINNIIDHISNTVPIEGYHGRGDGEAISYVSREVVYVEGKIRKYENIILALESTVKELEETKKNVEEAIKALEKNNIRHAQQLLMRSHLD